MNCCNQSGIKSTNEINWIEDIQFINWIWLIPDWLAWIDGLINYYNSKFTYDDKILL